MPVNPLPPSNTPRYFIDYTAMSIQHTVMIRMESALTDPASAFDELTDAMAKVMRIDDQITVIRFAAQGSDVTFPVATVGKNGLASNASAIADDPESVFYSAPFRGIPSGRKGRVDFYMPSNVWPNPFNNRFPWFTDTDTGDLEAALINLADTGTGGNQMVDISGARIIFNNYWNRAKSAYWQRKQRLG